MKSKKKKPKLTSRSPRDLSWVIWLIAGIILALGFVIRYYAFKMPVVGDEAVYGILGKKAMSGATLYKDIYEMKPPLLFYSYGLATSLTGWGTTGLRITGLILSLGNALLIFSIARRYADTAFSAMVGATAFFFLNNIYAFATETTAELFFLVFALGGYYLLLNPRIKKLSLNTALAGFLIAGAAMVKQTAALYGVGAIVLLILLSLRADAPYAKKTLFRHIAFLALGATTMILVNLLPILISGTLTEARYWLMEVPSSYTSSINFSDSLVYLDYLGMRILKYQNATIGLAVAGIASLFLHFRKSFFIPWLIFLIIGITIIIPGFRYYSQYWTSLITILALFLIPLKETIQKVKDNKVFAALLVSTATLACILIDTGIHKDEYFEKDYMLNAERAYSGSYPYVHYQLADYVRERLGSGQQFLMLGSQPFMYYGVEQLPLMNHVYPRLISRKTPENEAYQQRAMTEMRNGNYAYAMLSLTGTAWRTTAESSTQWYEDAFAYMQSDFTPVIAYNFDTKRYILQEKEVIDIAQPNQIIVFKKR